ncbi:MAG: hypothetical protein M1837_000398 [Sclerophora amabilis]|nr:MAG: hypothetical protein M1837_000398 [Sclerophora amabilis]
MPVDSTVTNAKSTGHKKGIGPSPNFSVRNQTRRVHGLDKEAWNDDTRVLKRVKRSESSSSISSLPSPSPSDEPDDSTRSSVQTSVSVVRNRKEGLTSNLRSALRDMESQRSMLDNQRRKLAQDIDDMKRMLHRYGDEDPERSSQTL